MNDKELELLKLELSTETDLPISSEKVIEQIKLFENGISYLKLVRPCKIGDGLKIISEAEQAKYFETYLSALDEGRVIKFVPASGAATRMFQKLISSLNKFKTDNYDKIIELANNGDEDCVTVKEFITNLNQFAFYQELKAVASGKGVNIDELISNNNFLEIIRLVAYQPGLNYANLPKGCILFHFYPECARTAFEEHVVEAINYSTGKDKIVKIHFTISVEHELVIKELFESISKKYQTEVWKFAVDFSFQSQSTDTISVTPDNKLFRDGKGKLVLRPGGHGALLKNLNDLKADIILIKNIDNVTTDHLKSDTYKYKKLLGGYLISLQKQVFNFLRRLESDKTNEDIIREIISFIKNEFEIDLNRNFKHRTLPEKSMFLFDFLNRPIRICGMVKREDHPGGSPFWVEGTDGELTKQIVESAQVEMSNPIQNKIFNDGTHFNPVDIVCGVKDFKGNHFDLDRFLNPDTGLISMKSKDGKDLKALELPGLWNGGMYHWLTVFVEVPKSTFTPVKEVNDLLKSEHQTLFKK